MPLSQNLLFEAISPEDAEFTHPPGAALMRRLSADLARAGWEIAEMDNWRDCGWVVMCRRQTSELEVVLSQIPDGRWMLQIAPSKVPGFVSRWFRGRQSTTAEQVHELARSVHRALSDAQFLGNPRWQWDGFPDDNHSTPEPNAA